MPRPWRLPETDRLTVATWRDSVVDVHGLAMDDPYVEEHWLPVLGPSATWLVRRLARDLGAAENEVRIDLAALARALGMAHEPGRDGPFARAFGRLVVFGLALPSPARDEHLFVRTRAPRAPRRHAGGLVPPR